MEVDYGSVCSGIESASIAWESLGMLPQWFAEIENFPSKVLEHHWPQVPNLGDMLIIADLIRMNFILAPSVLVGGTPCQSYSVAGKRLGLDDPRGQLTLAYVDILNAMDKQRGKGNESMCVWENVPGVLSDAGNAFGEFLAKLAGEVEPLQPSGGKWTNSGCVFGPQRTIAWRVIDAQYFGVAQRRRRLFVVASARKGFDPTKVLFEFEGVRRDIAPSRQTGEETAGTLTKSFGSRTGMPDCGSTPNQLVISTFDRQSSGEYGVAPVASTVAARDYKGASDLIVCATGDITHTLTAEGFDASEDGTGRGTHVVAYGIPGNHIGRQPHNGGNSTAAMPELSPCLTKTDRHGVAFGLQVRRLTPTECARLQGFDDSHCKIPYRNKSADECPDGPQYKAYGNSKAVPCVRWIGQRLLTELSRHDSLGVI